MQLLKRNHETQYYRFLKLLILPRRIGIFCFLVNDALSELCCDCILLQAIALSLHVSCLSQISGIFLALFLRFCPSCFVCNHVILVGVR